MDPQRSTIKASREDFENSIWLHDLLKVIQGGAIWELGIAHLWIGLLRIIQDSRVARNRQYDTNLQARNSDPISSCYFRLSPRVPISAPRCLKTFGNISPNRLSPTG